MTCFLSSSKEGVSVNNNITSNNLLHTFIPPLVGTINFMTITAEVATSKLITCCTLLSPQEAALRLLPWAESNSVLYIICDVSCPPFSCRIALLEMIVHFVFLENGLHLPGWYKSLQISCWCRMFGGLVWKQLSKMSAQLIVIVSSACCIIVEKESSG